MWQIYAVWGLVAAECAGLLILALSAANATEYPYKDDL